MTTAEPRHMRMLINRSHEACFNVERAMARATRCAPVLTFMPKGGMNEGILENGVDLLTDAKQRRDEIRDSLTVLRKRLSPIIDTLENPMDKQIMRMRYLEGWSVRKIALRLSFSERWIFKRLQCAEEKILKEFS